MTASGSDAAAAAAAERLAALGRLAGGVAHDFNNILTVVNGYAEILAQAVGDDEDARDAVEMILDAARRGGLVTRQLLQFSRRHDAEACELDIRAAVQECAPALRRLPAADVEVRIAVADAPALARIDREALTQALSLLVTHAGGVAAHGRHRGGQRPAGGARRLCRRRRRRRTRRRLRPGVGVRHRRGAGRARPVAHLRAVLYPDRTGARAPV